MKRLFQGAVAASVAALSARTANASCGSAFCFVNTNWSLQGIWTQPGPHFDLRYEYIDRDQPRAGSSKVDVGELPAHHDEVKTLNKVNDNVGLNLQLNYVYKGRDKGAEAEPEDSGGHVVAISPGITYAFTPAVQVYGFVQVPIYRYVNGVQLTADWSGTVGISVQF